MHKIFLIMKREYISRVTKKSFLVLTIALPLLIMGMMSAMVYFIAKEGDIGEKKKLVVADQSGKFMSTLRNTSGMEYTFSSAGVEELKKSFTDSGYDYLLVIPASLTDIQLLGKKKPNIFMSGKIEDALTAIIRQQRLVAAGIDTALLAQAQKPLTVKSLQLTASGVKDSQSGIAHTLGVFTSLLIYMSLLLFGAQVMRGVIEEKVSRIIEVVISSVRPFQLMMGKIIGVGLVGLTQFVLWIALTFALSSLGVATMFKGGNSMGTAQQVKSAQVSSMAKANSMSMEENGAGNDDVKAVFKAIDSLPVAEMVVCFLFYFLTGFFLYSAVFAAVGSAVDNETETQQFVLPITMPLIFTMMLSQSVIVTNPDSSLSFWLSIIPLTSPIAMMVRLPFGVPGWQIALSMVLMIGGFMGTTWAAARVYRVGILMYGKKASYKELAKWFMYKE